MQDCLARSSCSFILFDGEKCKTLSDFLFWLPTSHPSFNNSRPIYLSVQENWRPNVKSAQILSTSWCMQKLVAWIALHCELLQYYAKKYSALTSEKLASLANFGSCFCLGSQRRSFANQLPETDKAVELWGHFLTTSPPNLLMRFSRNDSCSNLLSRDVKFAKYQLGNQRWRVLRQD